MSCEDNVQVVTISIFCWITGTYLLETLSRKAIILHLPTDVSACHPGAWPDPRSIKIMQQPQKFQASEQKRSRKRVLFVLLFIYFINYVLLIMLLLLS